MDPLHSDSAHDYATPRPALMSLRLLAYLLDVIPITVGVATVFWLFFGLEDALRDYLENPRDAARRAAFISVRNDARNTAFVVLILYGMVMEGSPLQGTLGKWICRMRVAGPFGERLSMLTSVYRNLSKLLSYFFVFLGFFWAFFNRDRQTWHDKIARTFVVRR